MNDRPVWDRRFGSFLLVIDSVSSSESTRNIAACIATSSPSSRGYYAPPLSTPLIPRRRHERSTPPPLPPSSMPSVFLHIKGGMRTVSQSCRRIRVLSGPTSHLVCIAQTPLVRLVVDLSMCYLHNISVSKSTTSPQQIECVQQLHDKLYNKSTTIRQSAISLQQDYNNTTKRTNGV